MTQLITRADFAELSRRDPTYYYPGRWWYYRAAIGMLKSLRFESALEIGPRALPLVGCADTIDRRAEWCPTYLCDVRKTPWPIERRYDVVIGLQVFEHLGASQPVVFDELRRVARHAILSFPYHWNTPGDPIHHAIDDETIARWTRGHPMRQRRRVWGGLAWWRFNRLVCHFDFEASR